MRPALTALAFVLLAGCEGEIVNGTATISPANPSSPSTRSTAALAKPEAFGKTGLRRLTRAELAASLKAALGVDPGALLASVPEDVATTIDFDNEYGAQPINATAVTGYGTFATAFAVQAVASRPDFVAHFAGCTPAGPGDAACFSKLARSVGRLLLRRPVTQVEADRWRAALVPYAMLDSRFATAAELLLAMLLQHPETLYRIEAGTPTATPGLRALDGFEIATRMAFFIWGSAPDAVLLDAAEAGTLSQPAVRAAQAQRMLADPRAKQQWSRFHGEWLGYGPLALDPVLGPDMKAESDALVERITFDGTRDWMGLFTAKETRLTPALARHYGQPAPAAPGWVPYAGPRGGGILAHGSFLSLGAKFGDTSPTMRGNEVFKRIQCGKLGSPPDFVDIDNPPGVPGQCKPQSYSMRETAGCSGCHLITDNIGFGLENFGSLGEWRDTEPGRPGCTIQGAGSVGQTAFNGPAQLGELLAANDAVSACAARQLFRFMAGRGDEAEDEETVQALFAQYLESRTLPSMIVALVQTPAITFKLGSAL